MQIFRYKINVVNRRFNRFIAMAFAAMALKLIQT